MLYHFIEVEVYEHNPHSGKFDKIKTWINMKDISYIKEYYNGLASIHMNNGDKFTCSNIKYSDLIDKILQTSTILGMEVKTIEM